MIENPLKRIGQAWKEFSLRHPATRQFLLFFLLSNGVTILQILVMPVCKELFLHTRLVDIPFRILQTGFRADGSPWYVFDYPAGALASGGGGGLAYFLAVQIALALAQIINFFAQRNITFQGKGSVGKAAFWYLVAYLVITLGAATLQSLYKEPVYTFFMQTLGMGRGGEALADVVTMVINALLSFWVFFPIFKVIFRDKGSPEPVPAHPART